VAQLFDLRLELGDGLFEIEEADGHSRLQPGATTRMRGRMTGRNEVTGRQAELQGGRAALAPGPDY
jgi:hypothetical protein